MLELIGFYSQKLYLLSQNPVFGGQILDSARDALRDAPWGMLLSCTYDCLNKKYDLQWQSDAL
jgi:hypothetical protein